MAIERDEPREDLTVEQQAIWDLVVALQALIVRVDRLERQIATLVDGYERHVGYEILEE